jgi:hypothetical protein
MFYNYLPDQWIGLVRINHLKKISSPV